MGLGNPVAELEGAQYKVALNSWDPKMQELNPGQRKSGTNVEHTTQQIYNRIPIDNVSRQRRTAEFTRTNLISAEPSMTEMWNNCCDNKQPQKWMWRLSMFTC